MDRPFKWEFQPEDHWTSVNLEESNNRGISPQTHTIRPVRAEGLVTASKTEEQVMSEGARMTVTRLTCTNGDKIEITKKQSDNSCEEIYRPKGGKAIMSTTLSNIGPYGVLGYASEDQNESGSVWKLTMNRSGQYGHIQAQAEVTFPLVGLKFVEVMTVEADGTGFWYYEYSFQGNTVTNEGAIKNWEQLDREVAIGNYDTAPRVLIDLEDTHLYMKRPEEQSTNRS